METRVIKINSASETEKIKKAAETVRSGGLCAVPTETVYGLAADALNEEAVKNIFRAKNRPLGNPLTVHIADFSDVEKYCENVDERAKKLARRFMPGPITLILKKADIIPPYVTAGGDKVGVRMPDDEICRAIIRASGTPVVATSANASGSLSPTCADDVLADLDGKIDLVVDGGEPALGIESTVLDLTGKTPKILRQGAIGVDELQSVLGEDELIENPSPKTEFAHYRTNKNAVLVKSDLENFKKYLENFGQDVCVLCFDEEAREFEVKAVPFGSINNPSQQAKRLFSSLRKINALNVNNVLIRCPEGTDSVSLAVRDHLLKTAEGKIIVL